MDYFPFWSEEVVIPIKNKILYKILKKVIMKSRVLIDIFNRKSINRKMKNFDYEYVIIGGGELLGGHKGFNSSLYIWTKLLKKRNIPVIILGVSGDINMPKYMLRRNKKSLESCKEIFVRDHYTSQICQKEYNIKTTYIPDVVFGLKSICKISTDGNMKKNAVICVPIGYNEQIKKNLNICSKEKYKEYLLNLITKNIYENEEIIITSSVYNDEVFSKELYLYVKENLKKINVLFVEYSNLESYVKLTERANVVISARMHALILASLNECNVIPITFKEKLKYFYQEYGEKINVSEKENEVCSKLERIYKIIEDNED